MEHSKIEIIKALKVIQDICKEREESSPCIGCPLAKDGCCVMLTQPPRNWKIKIIPWRAFI